MQRGLISFCCLSYNHSKYIEECIKSIWNNDYKNIEILALYDGSTDNSFEILCELQKISPCHMRVFQQKNTGCIGLNFNKMFKEAKGEYIAIIACDDNFIENTIGKKIKYLLDDKNLAFVCDSKIKFVDENGCRILNPPRMSLDDIKKPNAKDLLRLDYKDIHSYYTQGAIYRKDIIDAIGGFDEDMICDDLVLRTKVSKYLLKNKKYRFKVFREEGVNYRRHSTNVSSNLVRQVMGVSQYYKRYYNGRPPENFLYWVLSSLKNTESNKQVLCDWFTKLGVLKYYKDVFNIGVAYKKTGIPFIFQLKKYKNRDDKKIKYLILFGIKFKL